MQDRKLSISVCKHRSDLTYKHQTMTWPNLIAKLSQTKRTGETVAEYKQKSKDDQSAIKDVGGFVLGDLVDGKRSKETVRSRSAICLDLDFAPADLWDQLTLLFPWSVAIYSTHKHTPEHPKFRVIIPLSRDVNPDEYEAIGRKLADDYMEMDWCDDTTFQPSRMMFWPSTSADGVYEFKHQDADLLDPVEILDLYEGFWNDISRWPFSSRVERKRETTGQKAGDPLAKSGPVGWFCKAYTIQEAIEAFIPDVYTPTDKDNRWTYAAGSTAGGFVIYDSGTLAYSNHMSDPCGDMHCVNAFDMVRIHKFGDKDKNKKANQIGVNLPSYKAMVEFVQKDPRVLQIQADEMFAAQVEAQEEDQTGISAEEFREANKEWQTQLTRNPKTGKVEDTLNNAVLVMEKDIKLQGFGGIDTFANQPTKKGSLPWWKYDETDATWTDGDLAELSLYLEKYYGIINRQNIKTARTAVWNRHAFHPIRDYLNSLEWDGTARLDTLLVDYLGAQDNAYTRAVTRKFFVAAVARVLKPGTQFDEILTLEGPQGCGKSQFIRRIAGDDWVNDSMQTFTGKEAYEALQGSWFVEVAELAANRRADVNQSKHFISKQSDKFRKAYAELTGNYKRQCVFVGTTNQADFLRDMTGNRRWWIVNVSGSGTKNIWKDLEEERDQIFAEAKHFFEAGETMFLDDATKKMAEEVQEEYRYKSVREDLIAEYLELNLPPEWNSWELVSRQNWLESKDNTGDHKREYVCTLEIWQEVLGGSRGNFPNADQREIGEILNKCGWKKEKKKKRMGKLYGVQSVYSRIDQ